MERFDVYDRLGNPTGKVMVRGEPMPRGCYRMVAGVLCMHRDGTVLLVKRHPDKPTHPNLFEASASGSVLAGEDAAQAAQRELLEETGIRCGELTQLYQTRDKNCLFRYYVTFVDCGKSAVRLQPEETVDYLWATKAQLAELLVQTPSPVILHAGVRRYLGLAEG
jgi:8-oxo-dGTP pyrophosphatase MutT (NUDIX family)